MFNLRKATVGVSLCFLAACNPQAKQEEGAPPGTSKAESRAAALEVPTSYSSEHSLPKGSSFYNALRALNFDSTEILKIVESAKSQFRLQGLSAGTRYTVNWAEAEQTNPLSVELRIAADSSLVIERKAVTDLEWTATRIQHPVTVTQKTFIGVVDSSLWESADLVGMDPHLISSLSEVFAWQVDFSRQVRQGDRWRLTVEQKSVGDEVIGWGNILVAEYENGTQSFTGIRYPQTGDKASYYATNGQSLKQMFLKSPIKYGRITSGFNKARFHPILNVLRPHNGVDYGAPAGTPVMALGRGTIVDLGSRGGSGNLVKIQHNGTYATAYLHLKGFAAGLRRGSVVEQGQVIGYVGATGLATGPHLHFAFYENGRFVDPLGRRFASADPIAASELPAFKQVVSSVLTTLPAWNVAQVDSGMHPTN